MREKEPYFYTYEIYINHPGNPLNGSYYYGKHKTFKLDDNYYGGGKLIRAYKKEFGIDHLEKTILCFYTSQDELDDAEQTLIEEKRKLLGTLCLNRHEGGKGGHWVEYITEEEYIERKKYISKMIHEKLTPGRRSQNARIASNAKNSIPPEQKLKWKHKDYWARVTEEEKSTRYKKVSESLTKFYSKMPEEEKQKRINSNRATNIEVSKRWRAEFKNIFDCQPETFRKFGLQKEAHDIFKKRLVLSKEDFCNEVKRFMDKVDKRRESSN